MAETYALLRPEHWLDCPPDVSPSCALFYIEKVLATALPRPRLNLSHAVGAIIITEQDP